MKILSIGDSWLKVVAGGGTPWPDIIGADNQGISGSTAAEWAADRDGRLTKAKNTEADVVIISLMGNDARHAVADGVVTTNEIVAALRNMRTVIETVLRPLTIVLLYADPFCGDNAQARMGVPLLNGAIKFACDMPVVFLDTSKFLGREHFDGTDIHPNRAGHEMIAIKAQEIIGGAA